MIFSDFLSFITSAVYQVIGTMEETIGTIYHNLPAQVLSLDRSIRFCCIVDRLGYIIASRYREGLRPLLTTEETRKNAMLSVIRHSTRKSWESKIGRTLYSITRYEHLTRATVPMDDGLLALVSFDARVQAVDRLLQKKVIPFLQEVSELSNHERI